MILLFSTFVTPIINAGYITMKTQTTINITDNSLKVKVTATNEGDEAAYNVQINTNENQRGQSSPIKQVLAVKDSFEYESVFDLPYTKHGRYPLVVSIDYTDANQYPFTAPSATYYSFGSDTVSTVFGSAKGVRLTNFATIQLMLKNIGEVFREVQIWLITPKELSVQEKIKKETLQPRSELNTAFTVSNFSALPGSRYQVFFIIEYEDESKHYSNIVPCFINLDESKVFFKKYKWYIIAVPSALFVALIIFQFILQKPCKQKVKPSN